MDGEEKTRSLNEIEHFGNSYSDQLIYRNLMMKNDTRICWSCGRFKYRFTPNRIRKCDYCLHLNWALNEMAHRPSMWLTPSPNVYLSRSFPCDSYRDNTVTELHARVYVNYNNYPPTYLLFSNKFGILLDSNDAAEAGPRLFALAMFRCKNRVRVPRLTTLCKTALCVCLHRISKQDDDDARSKTLVNGRIVPPSIFFYKMGIFRLYNLNTFLPKPIMKELYHWYEMLDRKTDLMNSIRQLEMDTAEIYQMEPSFDILL